MSDEATDETEGLAGDGPPDNILYNLYKQYIGEPEEETDVYLGFGLFFGGIALALAALGLFVWASSYQARSAEYTQLAGPAFGFGMLSLPTLILGIVVLLPVERRAVYASVVGAAVDVAAVGFFWLVAYPANWNVTDGTDYALPVVAVYAVGLTLVVGSTGAALVADQLERYRKPDPADFHPADAEEEEESEHYSDEEIQADIDSAMDGVNLSWGGVEKTEHRRLQFDVDEEIDASGFSQNTATVTRSQGVDSQIANLKAMKGGQKKTETSHSTVDDQTAKLKELRERQQREQERKHEEASLGSAGGSKAATSFFGRIKQALGR
ncbi:DUF7139 domain-containing protein [Haloarchaeobius sp. DFWS5]|uniref:DUF7139 domain-containing protein n=1 Tax=Haloarchaeobius sp. DFWS5 TaxID=3446114 RepID=UPI003EBB521C